MCKNKCHGDSLPIYVFKSKETSNVKIILMSQFSYYLLLQINHSKTLNNWTNSLQHEKTLRLVYNDFKTSFHQVLGKDNLQTLAFEICKVCNNIAPETMYDIFEIKNHQHNLLRNVCLQSRNVNTVLYDTETTVSLAAQISS